MKGLLIKDFQLMKNNAVFILLIIFISIACAAGLKNPIFAMGYATALISIFSVNTIAYDEYDNGMPHLFSLPISKKIYVQEKYVFAILISAIGLTIAAVISVMMSVFLGEYYESKEWIGIISSALFVVIVIQIVIMPVRMKFDSEKHKMAVLIVFGAIAAAGGVIFWVAETCGIDIEAILDGLLFEKAWVSFAVVLLLGAVLMYISYRVSVRCMEKREF